ncbi:S1C family serine protease [Paenibacillus sp. GP183]|uniref:S1C family serine protease n=1 Tax=Paenibacillus sp. GP183 TaxID=1882751 RepID=UPI000897B82C|nr:S1C family serine protease [Paenibacillus sp. GP183]SEC29684.1 serine protease Do [Paenibacillus sp. GP183]
MSLFDDDFYSTKSSKKQRHYGWSPRRGFSGRSLMNSPWKTILLAALGGAFIMILLFWIFGGSRVVPTAAPALASVDTRSLSGDPFVVVADKVKPVVVSVISTKKDDQGSGVGVGSGVIFQKNGGSVYILTNNHVVEGATQFEIVTALGEHKKASLVGKDRISDLAVLEASADGVKAIAEFGNSDNLKAGEFAIAVGNPLGLGYSPTVTLGIISIPKRTIPVSLTQGGEYDWEMDVIQTDAAINQGNSGGPLVNIEGQVIGINSLKISDTGVEGLGFAIPINSAKPIIDSLISNHKVKRPLMGVSTQELQSFKGTEVLKLPAEVKTGVIVFEVSGPAKDAGIQSQDVIVQLDSRKIATTIALRKYLYYEKKIGDQVNVTFYRGGKKMNTTLTLTEAGDK